MAEFCAHRIYLIFVFKMRLSCDTFFVFRLVPEIEKPLNQQSHLYHGEKWTPDFTPSQYCSNYHRCSLWFCGPKPISAKQLPKKTARHEYSVYRFPRHSLLMFENILIDRLLQQLQQFIYFWTSCGLLWRCFFIFYFFNGAFPVSTKSQTSWPVPQKINLPSADQSLLLQFVQAQA